MPSYLDLMVFIHVPPLGPHFHNMYALLGFVLTVMGVSQDQLRMTLKAHAKGFIAEISPLVRN